MELFQYSIGPLREMLAKKEISATELTRALLDRINSVDSKINAYITVTGDLALKQAAEADARIASGGDLPLLNGIPMAVKDIFCTKDVLTTCGSKILHNFIPPYESTVSRKLLEAGAIMLGKANMDEFAMGSSNETSYFGAVKNPWDLERIPGGSSGGSAAATAANECIASVGTDTGGSIRQPASLCGIVGMKPTYGRVSRYGMIAFASSLDQAGPLVKCVEDAAYILQVIAGHDPIDSTCVDVPVPNYLEYLGKDIKGLKIGVPKEYFIEGMQPDVEKSVREAFSKMEELGAEFTDISLPTTDYALATYYLIAPAEASSNLARYDGVKYGYRSDKADDLMEMYKTTRAEGFGDEVKRRIMIGTYALSSGYYDAYYLKAQKARTLIKQDFDKAFEKVDVIATPTSPSTAFKLGEKFNDPLQMYLSDIFTLAVNISGLPGISVPCGFDGSNLPIGLQFIAPNFKEELLLQTAYAYEQSVDFQNKRPVL